MRKLATFMLGLALAFGPATLGAYAQTTDQNQTGSTTNQDLNQNQNQTGTTSDQYQGTQSRTDDPNAGMQTRTDTDTADMPDTAANWLALVMGGGLLSGAGMVLRRRK